jgi:endo-1,4-beta-xylanase
MGNNVPSLAERYKGYFSIGAAVNAETLERDSGLIAYQFNSLTAENDMKFEILQPEKDRYDFEVADRYADYARKKNIKMRGHTLVWHNQTPDWVFQDEDGNDVNRETLIERMKSHIETVMKRYEDVMYAWDIVNEVIEDKGDHLLRKSKWLDIIGDDYVEIAYKHAMKVCPNVALFYNDYHATWPDKREKIKTLITNLREKGVRIDGIGLQGHWNIETPTIEEIKEALEVYKSMDLRIHVTEMDLKVFKEDDNRTDLTEPLPGMMAHQADRYGDIFSLFRQHSDYIDNVTFWGVTDYYTWLDHFVGKERITWPLLFDKDSEPKPAFWKVIDFQNL